LDSWAHFCAVIVGSGSRCLSSGWDQRPEKRSSVRITSLVLRQVAMLPYASSGVPNRCRITSSAYRSRLTLGVCNITVSSAPDRFTPRHANGVLRCRASSTHHVPGFSPSRFRKRVARLIRGSPPLSAVGLVCDRPDAASEPDRPPPTGRTTAASRSRSAR
jgi:hypothetical protein